MSKKDFDPGFMYAQIYEFKKFMRKRAIFGLTRGEVLLFGSVIGFAGVALLNMFSK